MDRIEELRQRHSLTDEWLTPLTPEDSPSPVATIFTNLSQGLSQGLSQWVRKSRDYVVKQQTHLKTRLVNGDTQKQLAAHALASGKSVDIISQGIGLRFYPDGTKFEGNFVGGKRHGYGVLYDLDGTVTYEGNWKKDLKEGTGTGLGPLGMYKGEWKSGKAHGKGTLRTPEWAYSGEWKNGVQEGKGVKVFGDLKRYEGSWVNNRMEGFGVLHLPNGESHSGMWEGNKCHGTGVRTSPSGAKIVGRWERGTYKGPVE